MRKTQTHARSTSIAVGRVVDDPAAEQHSNSAPLKIVIADHEPLSRARMQRYLTRLDQVVLVRECASGTAALDVLEREQADILFVDVDLLDEAGLAAVGAQADRTAPTIVLLSSDARHAVLALELQAVDFILKPFDTTRVARAVERASVAIERARELERFHGLLAYLRGGPVVPATLPLPDAESTDSPQILVRDGHRRRFIDLDSIDWIESYGNYARLHVGNQTILHRETMARLERQLAGARFARIHRAAILNLKKIAEVQPGTVGQLRVVLVDGTKLRVSRRYRDSVEWMRRA
jgi:two-component system LytT family response regulator